MSVVRARSTFSAWKPIQYGPARPAGPGPLGQAKEALDAWRGASYTEKVSLTHMTVYRVHGEGGRQLSNWLSRARPRGPLQAKMDFALRPEFHNPATQLAEVRIGPGWTYYEGYVGPQGADLIGGVNQIYVPAFRKPPPGLFEEWVKKVRYIDFPP